MLQSWWFLVSFSLYFSFKASVLRKPSTWALGTMTYMWGKGCGVPSKAFRILACPRQSSKRSLLHYTLLPRKTEKVRNLKTLFNFLFFFFFKYAFWDATDHFWGKMSLISVSQFENWRTDDQFCILSSEQNWHCVLLCVWTAGICYKHNFPDISDWSMRNTMVESWTQPHLVHITNATLGSLHCIIYFPVCHSLVNKYK